MHLFLQREKTENATMGKLSIDREWFCHTLEPKHVNPAKKIWGQTATPAGCYLIWLRRSPSFGRELPTLIGVPGFTGVLMHRGNRVSDSDGCILLGFKRGTEELNHVIWESAKAEEALMCKLWQAEKSQVLAITIKDYEKAD